MGSKGMTEDELHTMISGRRGNVIYVNAGKNIAVGVTGWFKPRIFDRVEFIEKVVVPMAE